MILDQLLAELEEHGQDNDAQTTERSQKLLNITKDTGEFLAVMVKATKAQAILEIGTSNGYSTLWFASSLPETGNVTTVEVLPHKIALASHNFQKAKLSHKIKQIESNAVDYFKKLDQQQFDIIFLDAERSEYMLFANKVVTALKPGGLLICDNAISHASELADFIAYIKNHQHFTTSLLPVGKGEFIACKAG